MRSAIAAVALALTAASGVMAQSKPQTRDGFTIGFGVGLGSAGISCSGCTTDRENAGSGYLRIGGAVRPNLILAGELEGWDKSFDDQGTTDHVTIGFVTGTALWYPEATGGFYVKGGLGVGSIEDEVKDPTFTVKLESSGLAISFGLGYDYRVGKNFSLTPYASYVSTVGAKAKVNGSSTGEKLNANLFQVGLGFTWH